jgi:hypothetical protein
MPGENMKDLPGSVFTTLILILFNAAFWLFYAGWVAFARIGSFQAASLMKWVMVILALCASAALAGAVAFLRRRSRLAFYAAAALLVLIAVLSITDEFGLLDLFSFLLSLIPLGLLLKDRAWYLQAAGG